MFRFLRRQSLRWLRLLGLCELLLLAVSLCLATYLRYIRCWTTSPASSPPRTASRTS